MQVFSDICSDVPEVCRHSVEPMDLRRGRRGDSLVSSKHLYSQAPCRHRALDAAFAQFSAAMNGNQSWTSQGFRRRAAGCGSLALTRTRTCKRESMLDACLPGQSGTCRTGSTHGPCFEPKLRPWSRCRSQTRRIARATCCCGRTRHAGLTAVSDDARLVLWCRQGIAALPRKHNASLSAPFAGYSLGDGDV